MTDRVSIVTGGAGVFGKAIGERLARRGDTVVLVDRDGTQAEAVAKELTALELPGTVLGAEVDVASDAANRQLVADVRERHGRLDCLINNAGVSQKARFGSLTYEEWRMVLDVNLWGPTSLSQAAAAVWREEPGGAIVNMASRTWSAGGPLSYASSKAGVVGLTRALAAELGRYDVRVNALAPSFVPAPRIASMFTPEGYQEHIARAADLPLLNRTATADDVAGTVAYLTSPDSAFVSGEVIHVTGGSQLPRPAFKK
ncbi:SDR family NAD(P)-dependent oxidoreductase [Saccharomonospora sp. NPDC046836]|uniref:SDR family NAD(P)-dependent oxidoreductase n=1 Tax=Saccharomonospora sp. NPDC046836 TaxID=3156921 RepID=UPI0033DD7F01